jgi:roadblock/LC7 domain-containing protein
MIHTGLKGEDGMVNEILNFSSWMLFGGDWIICLCGGRGRNDLHKIKGEGKIVKEV